MQSKSDLLKRMAIDLAILPSHLEQIIRTAPLRYKDFNIPKKAGGFRRVAQPAREVKLIQYWVINEITSRLPVHESATAYRQGSSIIKNAEAHVFSRHMLKLDFENFFPSITKKDITLHLERFCSDHLDLSARETIAHLCCWVPARRPPLRLCIGAPTSPLISNTIMFEFDSRISEMAKKESVQYTRYADDITLSSRERIKLDHYQEIIIGLLQDLDYPKLRLNSKKTVRASRADKRIITGLIVTPNEKISIGRDRKRLIRSMYHKSLYEELDEAHRRILSGLLAFADSIEPGYSDKLEKSIKKKDITP